MTPLESWLAWIGLTLVGLSLYWLINRVLDLIERR